MNHPLFPIIILLIIVFVYFPTKLIIRRIHKENSTKEKSIEAIFISGVIVCSITYAWWYSGTSAQRWAENQCKQSKLNIYSTAESEGFYQLTYSAGTDLLRAVMDGSFHYVETNTKNKYSKKRYSKYYLSNKSDVNCQHDHALRTTEWAQEKRAYGGYNLPTLGKGKCVAIEYRNNLESRYEYSSITSNASGKGNRRKSIKLVRDLEDQSILAQWEGYSGSSIMGASVACSYPYEDLPFKKALHNGS